MGVGVGHAIAPTLLAWEPEKKLFTLKFLQIETNFWEEFFSPATFGGSFAAPTEKL